MENVNIGIANLIVSNLLKESYLTTNSLNEAEKVTSDLLNIVKESPILQLEFKVFNNIENKEIDDDTLAPRYIDSNIKLFEVYTIDELKKEHEKLKPFIKDTIIEDDRVKLYNSIGCLIEESLKPNEDINVDQIHESFSVVLDHIKKPKENLEKMDNSNEINEEVIEIAVNKFNERYENMTLAEADLFNKLINYDDNQKRELFEEYKNKDINLLKSLSEENKNDKITKSLEKINEMEYNPKQVDSDIIKLFELKQGLR